MNKCYISLASALALEICKFSTWSPASAISALRIRRDDEIPHNRAELFSLINSRGLSVWLENMRAEEKQLELICAAASAALRSEPSHSGTLVPNLLNKWLTTEPLLTTGHWSKTRYKGTLTSYSYFCKYHLLSTPFGLFFKALEWWLL